MQELFLFSKMPQTSSGPTRPPVPWVPVYFPRGKWSGHEVDLSPQSAAGIKNVWSYTSALPIRLHGGQGQLYCLLYVACCSYVLKGRAWGSLYSVARADSWYWLCLCWQNIRLYLYVCDRTQRDVTDNDVMCDGPSLSVVTAFSIWFSDSWRDTTRCCVSFPFWAPVPLWLNVSFGTLRQEPDVCNKWHRSS